MNRAERLVVSIVLVAVAYGADRMMASAVAPPLARRESRDPVADPARVTHTRPTETGAPAPDESSRFLRFVWNNLLTSVSIVGLALWCLRTERPESRSSHQG